jgi:hypothetical protein
LLKKLGRNGRRTIEPDFEQKPTGKANPQNGQAPTPRKIKSRRTAIITAQRVSCHRFHRAIAGSLEFTNKDFSAVDAQPVKKCIKASPLDFQIQWRIQMLRNKVQST